MVMLDLQEAIPLGSMGLMHLNEQRMQQHLLHLACCRSSIQTTILSFKLSYCMMLGKAWQLHCKQSCWVSWRGTGWLLVGLHDSGTAICMDSNQRVRSPCPAQHGHLSYIAQLHCR